jgi:hypothetical protein
LTTRDDRAAERPADVSVVVLASKQEALEKVKQSLENARLLTTRLYVVEPLRCKVAIKLTAVEPNIKTEKGRPTTWCRPAVPGPSAVELRLTLHGREDMEGRRLLNNAETAIKRFLDPYSGGSQEKGWPFGGAIHLSQIYDLLARQPGVDYVAPTTWSDAGGQQYTALALLASESWRLSNTDLKTVSLEPHELPQALVSTEDPKLSQ